MKTSSMTTVGRALLLLCALSAALAAAAAVPVLRAAGPADRLVETWRCYGFATFAVLFLALAHRPRGSRGLWVAVLGNKAALSATALVWSGRVAGASDAAMWDGALTVALIAALLLTRGWQPPTVTAGADGTTTAHVVPDPPGRVVDPGVDSAATEQHVTLSR